LFAELHVLPGGIDLRRRRPAGDRRSPPEVARIIALGDPLRHRGAVAQRVSRLLARLERGPLGLDRVREAECPVEDTLLLGGRLCAAPLQQGPGAVAPGLGRQGRGPRLAAGGLPSLEGLVCDPRYSRVRN